MISYFREVLAIVLLGFAGCTGSSALLRVKLLVMSLLILTAEEDVQSVGKLRSAADTAFSKGDLEQSLKFWKQVRRVVTRLRREMLIGTVCGTLQVVDLEPQNPSNFYKRFRVHLRQKSLHAAVADLSSAIALNAEYEQAYGQRGKLNLRLGNCIDAEKDFLNLKRWGCSVRYSAP